MRKPVTRIVRLRRVRDHGRRQHITHWFEFVDAPRHARSSFDHVKLAQMPPFDGEEGWFLVERIPKGSGHAWPYWRALRQVEGPEG